jgi:hypothetical protein
MEGWVKFHRKVYDNFLYKENRPHTKREAWEDLVVLVNYEDSYCLIGNEKIICKRGQSLRSLDAWGKLFKWNKSKVRRFFDLLNKEKMILIENLSKTTRITICNYDIYQGEQNAFETHLKRKRNAFETRATPNKNNKNDKNDKREERAKIFYDELKTFLETYPKEMIRAFFDYWSEPNKSKTKMKFELQDTWDTPRRLKAWANREKTISPKQKEVKSQAQQTIFK